MTDTVGLDYDLKLPASLLQARPAWFDEVPWERCRERELSDDTLATLEYMDLIEGHVCSGYLHLALASASVRARTERTDFAAGWGVQENWHGIALHRFLDQYEGRTVSTRAAVQDERRGRASFKDRNAQLFSGGAAALSPDLYAAVYACLGYRNEVMTLRGYGSLLTKVNTPSPHPVLDPLLRHLMNDEGLHARFYRQIAESYLRDNRRAQRAARLAMNLWWGTVGENFAGSEGADRVILYLFRDERGRDLAEKVDSQVASLPGLAGVRPMRRRLDEALRRNAQLTS